MSEPGGQILFLVPARGSSRRVPGKNLRVVGGVPLVGRAVRTARAAAAMLPGGPHRVVCSTDDAEIAAAAAAWGGEILDRPAALATAEASSVDVALHALDSLGPFDTLVLVQPTSPLVEPADLVAVIERHRSSGAPATTVAAGHPASWHHALDASGVLAGGAAPLDNDVLLTGACYAISPDELRSARRFVVPGRTVGHVVPPERAVDVDDEGDLLLARALLAARSSPVDVIAEDASAPATADSVGSGSPAGRRKITVLTTGRQDWGILHSVCAAIRAHPDLELDLVAGGMHLSPRHGRPVELTRADGFVPAAELRWLPDNDVDPDPPAEEQAAAALALVGRHLAGSGPDAFLVAGDRFETAAAALAATLSRVPIVHLHGGEQTLGAFDNELRHAITKLAHLHLVSTDEHAQRVIAMGEDPAAVYVIGAPSLDAAFRTDLPDRRELGEELGLELGAPVVIVTVHPTTLDQDPAAVAAAVVAAMDEVPATYVVTLPNVDPGSAEVARLLTAAAARPGRVAVRALGERRYWGLLRVSGAMLGNSSSGIVEAPAVGLPSVNVGDRQAERHRERSVVDVAADPAAVAEALRRVLAPGFREALPLPATQLADGRAGMRAAAIIAAWHPSRPPRKRPIHVAP